MKPATDKAELEGRAIKLLAALRDWVYASQRNLDCYTDVYHEADEGKRYQGALEIVVKGLGLAPEDAAILMGLMKTDWNLQGEMMGKSLDSSAPPLPSSPEGNSQDKK